MQADSDAAPTSATAASGHAKSRSVKPVAMMVLVVFTLVLCGVWMLAVRPGGRPLFHDGPTGEWRGGFKMHWLFILPIEDRSKCKGWFDFGTNVIVLYCDTPEQREAPSGIEGGELRIPLSANGTLLLEGVSDKIVVVSATASRVGGIVEMCDLTPRSARTVYDTAYMKVSREGEVESIGLLVENAVQPTQRESFRKALEAIR